MNTWCKNSAWSVARNARPAETDSAVLLLHTAKNGTVSGQLLLRDVQELTIRSVSVDALPDGVQAEFYLQEHVVFNDGVPYPDRLPPFTPCRVAAHTAQGIWLVLRTSAAAAAGRYSLTLRLGVNDEEYCVPVQLHIYEVTLPEPRDGAFDHEYFFSTNALCRYGEAYAMYSPRWWELMKAYAQTLRQLRVNHLYLGLFPYLTGRRTGTTDWTFDFSRFHEVVGHFMHWGSFRRLVIAAPLKSLTGETIPGFDENGTAVTYGLRTPEGEAYAACLLHALRGFLEESGYLSRVLLHLADEPHETENWLWYRELVRQILPEVPCGEPLDEYDSALQLQDACDEFVPRLEIFEQGRNYFAKLAKAGKRVWCYSCCYPEDPWYLNKFIDLPSRYSRLMSWACYAQQLTGFLHWGFNQWDTPLYGMQPDARFKGDGYIVYPDVERGSVQLSNRALATLEGVEEYELLAMAAKHQPEAALALSRSIARSFRDFEADPDALERARVQLLCLCEAACEKG